MPCFPQRVASQVLLRLPDSRKVLPHSIVPVCLFQIFQKSPALACACALEQVRITHEEFQEHTHGWTFLRKL